MMAAKVEVKEKSSAGKLVYDSLMNGIRHMIPFVVSGGIIMAVSFMFGVNAFDINDVSYSPIAALLYEIGKNNAQALMVPVLAGYIAYGLAGPLGLTAGMVSGLISINTSIGFFGGIVGGLLAGGVVILMKRLLTNFPKSFVGIRDTLIIPLVSVLIVGVIMFLVVATPMKVLNDLMVNGLSSLSGSNLVILGLVVGMMMGFDLGGPVNKSAYAFGLAALAAGNYYPMPAIMAAGMVPPMGVALATMLFKKKFDEEDITQGKSCFILGLSFITPAVLPIAAKDLLHIVPATMAGSAVTAMLVMLFRIALPAPHGGIFVLPIIQGGIMKMVLFVVALAAGTIVTALIIGLIKKDLDPEALAEAE